MNRSNGWLIIAVIYSLTWTLGCENDEKSADAYGFFTMEERYVTPSVSGIIIRADFNQGDRIKIGDRLAIIDTMNVYHQRDELDKSMALLTIKNKTVDDEAHSLNTKIEIVNKKYNRIRKMFEGGAATEDQLDSISGELKVLKIQSEALKTKRLLIAAEKDLLLSKRESLVTLYKKHIIKSEINGRLAEIFSEESEMAMMGKPLYLIRDMSQPIIDVFISQPQLSSVRLGDKVTVNFDSAEGVIAQSGEIIHISTEAEFTPSTIQTREQRRELVYRLRIRTSNSNEMIKAGMPGDIVFNKVQHDSN